MMRKINKKAQQFKFLYLLIWAVFLSVVLVIIAFFTSAFVRQQIDVRDAEARLVINRLLYSPTGISYYDKDLSRNYPGTVDLKKISNDFLDYSINAKDNQMMAALINVTSTAGGVSKAATFNELWYTRWLPLAGQKGSGASTWIREYRYVSIYEGEEFKGPGMIEISVLMPNG